MDRRTVAAYASWADGSSTTSSLQRADWARASPSINRYGRFRGMRLPIKSSRRASTERFVGRLL
jgi:hypothetical protein